jgi:hypothetical protein
LAKKLIAAGTKCGVTRPLLRGAALYIRRNVSEEERSEISLLAHIKEVLGVQQLTFGISLGTPGSHRKPVIQALTTDGSIVGYAKVGFNEATKGLVQNETDFLQRLTGLSLDSFRTPTVLYAGWWEDRFLCVQSAPEAKAQYAPRTLTSLYLDSLKELKTVHLRWMPLEKSVFWTTLLERIEGTENSYYKHVLRQGVHVAEALAEKMAALPFHLCHGDFTPWNAKLVNKRLFLFDWEYADLEAPPGLDLVHFLYQTKTLLEKRSPVRIYRELQKKEVYRGLISIHLENFDPEERTLRLLVLLYLLKRISHYASGQPASFQQLHPLITLLNLFEAHRESAECPGV